MDRHFAAFICRLASTGDRSLWLAAALASQAVGGGHVCLDLTEAASCEEAKAAGINDPAAWAQQLRNWAVVGSPGEFTPLVLDNSNRLYLHRYWNYEQELAATLLHLAGDSLLFDKKLLKAGVDRLFPAQTEGEPDLQLLAAILCTSRRFTVIAGGPGTGKTSTVLRVLILLIEQFAGKCRIALVAPTGKAAARLRESVQHGRSSTTCDAGVLAQIPEDVSTIHRLLGYVEGSSRFRHNRENPLPYDVIVVDEASMVSLPLMAKLVEALRDTARLILLGDRDQLASVEAGAILGDICDTGHEHRFSRKSFDLIEEITSHRPITDHAADESVQPLNDSIVVLRKSYRFAAESGIGELSRLVNEGDGAGAMALLNSNKYADLIYYPSPPIENLQETLAAYITAGFRPYLMEISPERALASLADFRILCALRQGPYGTAAINHLVETVLAKKGIITPNGRWYAGQPIMVTRNDYGLRLFNGDMGIMLPDPVVGNELRAFFTTADGSLRSVLPLRLPQHETAFAMTVHKSQGSEFDRVLLLLPDRQSDVLTRELVYTALTRAKSALVICGPADVFVTAIGKRMVRKSGLREALWGKS